ncbi:SseB family protein [Methanobrevibacter sp.]|uniref:SseB family protein n=1 Tax=Methanobrevibacter sp. TaxID=66852 RepID=UPI00388DF953
MNTHKHLRTVIEDIYANGNEITPELLTRLINEFRYSSLYIPAKKENGTLNFIIYEEGPHKYTPLFTDLDEFRKFYGDDEVEVFENSFELYRNVLKTTDIDGYILNPSCEKYLFKRDFILGINNIPKTNFYTTDPYSEEELTEIMASVDNSALEDFIRNPANIGNWEALFERLASSRLLGLMTSNLDLSDHAENGLISQKSTGPLASMYTDRLGGVYATVFTSDSKMAEVSLPGYRYAQIINLATLVNFILTEDMDGLIINPESDSVLIPRTVLLKYSLGFERFANDERLSESIYYLFLLNERG